MSGAGAPQTEKIDGRGLDVVIVAGVVVLAHVTCRRGLVPRTVTA